MVLAALREESLNMGLEPTGPEDWIFSVATGVLLLLGVAILLASGVSWWFLIRRIRRQRAAREGLVDE
jgi:hypothetical protein